MTNMMDGPVGSKVQEKYLLQWTNELRKVAQEEERRLEARETRKMGEEVQTRAREHEAKRRSLERWHAHATEAQRLQDKKEQAWDLYRRVPNFRSKKEDFEKDLEHKVVYNSKTDEQSLQDWIDDMQTKVLAGEHPLEV